MTDILTVYTDFVCPWCYIGDTYLQQALAQAHVTVEYVMYPLHPETPHNGMALEDLFAARGIDVKSTQLAIREKATSMGLEYGERTHTYNSRNAQVVGKALMKYGVFERYKQAVFCSYFGRGENISSKEVLQAILDELQIERINVSDLIEDPSCQELVDLDWKLCSQNNINGVPAFQYGNRYCVGAQSSDSLLKLINP